jgi:uncharacterized protein YbbK (DUF523 family)
LLDRATVIEVGGRDVTAAFIQGAAAALAQVQRFDVRIAVLKEGSPSCGTAYTYDGTFSGGTTNKPGVTASLLRQHGVLVFSEFEFLQAEVQLKRIESGVV